MKNPALMEKKNGRNSSKRYLLAATCVFITIPIVYRIARITALGDQTWNTGTDIVGYVSLPMLAAEARMVYRRSLTWNQTLVVTAMTIFVGFISAAAGTYLRVCSNTLTDTMHLTKGASDKHNLSTCVLAGAALTTASFVCSLLAWYAIAAADTFAVPVQEGSTEVKL